MVKLSGPELDVRQALLTRVSTAPDDCAPLDICLTSDALVAELPSMQTSAEVETALGHVNQYEAEQGRPLLGALVVCTDIGRPEPWFYESARTIGRQISDEDEFWRAEVGELLAYWNADPELRPAV